MRIALIGLFLVMVVASCGTSGSVGANSESNKETYLLIGEGGGITGAYTEYIVYPDGRVEVWDELEQESVFKGTIPKKEASAIFDRWAEVSEIKVPAGRPGNMNYRIGFHEKETVKTLRWSDSQNIDARILEFYSSTFQLLRNAE